jgi:cytochrome c biogenesis protein CcmG/thiol:disulfide interchange protein DsbE
MKRLLIVLVVVVALGSLLAYGLFTPRNDREVVSARLEKPMPDFEIPLFERYQAEYGETFTFASNIGRPMVINFWASWCYPACYREAPELEAAYQEYRDSVTFVGIATQDTDEKSNEFLDQFNLSFPNGKDSRNRIFIDYGVLGVPETFFIRADGTLSKRHTGEITRAQLEQELRVLLQ